ncbi:hypothetical protein ACH4FX_11980 [Streptomyces sp. NPDC018019]|uniref:hypothetical protein n=1 Tax=Streptomyces sp. NPDC018019 TaxID=3365030 RepID=UPI00378C4B3C
MGNDYGIAPLASYQNPAYCDLDRSAAEALRLPLLALLLGRPASERAEWLATLVAGFSDGLEYREGVNRESDTYWVGHRMALLIVEEGHA